MVGSESLLPGQRISIAYPLHGSTALSSGLTTKNLYIAPLSNKNSPSRHKW
jgi:hypothetical protein